MGSERFRAVAAAATVAVAAAALAAGCTDAFAPAAAPPVSDSLTVRPLSMSTVLLEWKPVTDEAVTGYQVERRADLTGPYATVAEQVAQTLPGPVIWLDTGLAPDRFYGYRIVAVSRLGAHSRPSIVRGTRTPPRPAVLLNAVSLNETAAAADLDGYVGVVRNGTDSMVSAVPLNGEQRFPVPPGTYTAELRGLAANCTLESPAVQNAAVTDVGVNTVDTLSYTVRCLDPSFGRIAVIVQATGDSLDADGYHVTLDGVLADASLPDSLRLTHDSARLADPAGGVATFARLRAGAYSVQLGGVDPKCTTPDGTTADVDLAPLDFDTVTFAVACPVTPPQDTTQNVPGYQYRNVWSAVSGGRITLTVSLDMGAFNDAAINGAGPDDIFAIQGSTEYDASQLRFVSAANVGGSKLSNGAFNGSAAGVIQWQNFTTAPPATGLQGIMVVTFDVVGTGTVTTRSRVDIAESQDEVNLVPKVVIRESAANLGGGGGGQNQAPTASANGPYAGTAGQPLTLSAAGSNDPDGTIASYSWNFGDGTASGTGVSVQHTYSAAGVFTVTLTVTDNLGATASATAAATITNGGGQNQPPVANANGPYSGTAGQPITFNAAGSSDPDGTVASYSWTFGDGTPAGAGASVQHVYAAPGSYTVVLTVTDNLGATGSAQTTATVAPGGGGAQPFTFGYAISRDADSLIVIVRLDLSADIPETPGVEELLSFRVDSLKWNPAVMQFRRATLGPGTGGSVNPTFAAQGKLSIQGSVNSTNNRGLITLATIVFRDAGTPGQSTVTATALGAITGTVATGSYNYLPKTAVVEATLTVR